MNETSPMAAVARPPLDATGREHWQLRDTAGRAVCDVQARIVSDEGRVLPNDGKLVGELEVRGPWVTASYYQDATRRSSPTAGCAPATSGRSTDGGSSP
jgi:fatty-acyl-CoA synthase